MTQYNTLNLKLPNSQINKLKFGIKNGTEVTLKLSSNVVGDSNDENNFPHKLLFTNTQVLRLCIVFPNGLSANIKISKTQSDKIGQSIFRSTFRTITKNWIAFNEKLLKPLAKSVLLPVVLTAAASAIDAVIHKKMFGSGHHSELSSRMTTSIILNEELNDIMKRVKSHEESGLLIKDISKTIKNQGKEQKSGFFSMSLETLGAGLLGNLIKGKDTIRAGEGMIRVGKDTIRAGQDF